MRAPLAPPRRSESRYVEAEAHAVSTSSPMESPDFKICAFNVAMSAASITAWFKAGIGSCQMRSSLGASGPM